MNPTVLLWMSYTGLLFLFLTSIVIFQSKKKKSKGDNKVEKLTISELIHKAISALVSFMSILSPALMMISNPVHVPVLKRTIFI